MDSLVESEHLFREATRQQGLLNLGMQRIDVRCSALESISTQATLVAGFAFGSLAPDVLDGLIGDDVLEEKLSTPLLRQAFATAFISCSAISFAASIWVIYMALCVLRLKPPLFISHARPLARLCLLSAQIARVGLLIP